MYIMVEAPVENIIMNIPVEVETDGGTPSDIIKGLKMEPPPRPKAPPTHPPNKAPRSKESSWLPPYLISLSIRPIPAFILRAYSLLFQIRPIILIMTIMSTKTPNIVQSNVLHLWTSMMGLFPRSSVTHKFSPTVINAIKILGHYLRWEFSASSIKYNFWYSFSSIF